MKKKVIALLLVCVLSFGNLLATFAEARILNVNVDEIIMKSTELSKELKTFALKAVSNDENLWLNEFFEGKIVRIYKTDKLNTVVSITGDVVEVITLEGKNLTINNKPSEKVEFTLGNKGTNCFTMFTEEGNTKGVMGGTYIEISKPSGYWDAYSTDYVDFSTENEFASYSIAALCGVLGLAFSGIPAAIVFAIASKLITDELTGDANHGEIYREILEHRTLFKTYQIRDEVYVLKRGVKVKIDSNKWWETWCP